MTLLVDLMLQPIRKERPSQSEGESFAICPVPGDVSEKQQVGFLTLLGDVLKHLASRVVSRWPTLLETLLDLIASAQATLALEKGTHEDEVVDDGDAVAEDESEEVEDPATNNTESRALSLSRSATPVNSVTSTKRACSSPHPEEPSKKFARSEDEGTLPAIP